MISDGYGDQTEIEHLLIEEEAFFVRNARHALVKKIGKGFPEGAEQDAIQEARIAAWQSWTKHQSRAYMNIATRQRLMQHVYRDQWFGTTPSGRDMDPIRRANRDSLDDPDCDLVLVAQQVLDSVMLAYHEGEIVEAINALTPDQREYVVLRFWHGMTNPEIAAIQGKSVGAVSSAWSTYIAPSLRSRLAHLVGIV